MYIRLTGTIENGSTWAKRDKTISNFLFCTNDDGTDPQCMKSFTCGRRSPVLNEQKGVGMCLSGQVSTGTLHVKKTKSPWDQPLWPSECGTIYSIRVHGGPGLYSTTGIASESNTRKHIKMGRIVFPDILREGISSGGHLKAQTELRTYTKLLARSTIRLFTHVEHIQRRRPDRYT